MTTTEAYPAIESLGAVGDGRSMALVAPDGSIEWYCPLRFDADPLVWPLLDRRRGGVLRVGVEGAKAAQLRYVPETAVLEHVQRGESGTARCTSFMPWAAEGDVQELLFVVEVLEGTCRLSVDWTPAPGFGAARFEVQRTREGSELRSSAVSALLTSTVASGASLHAGDRACVRLAAAPSHHDVRRLVALTEQGVLDELERTTRAWRRWVGELRYDGAHRDDVVRSAITLRLLIYEPTGAVAAAATTSLPEDPGGVRNWDYRFTWLRDAQLTVLALYRLGCDREASRYAEWLFQTTRRAGLPLHVLYGVDGSVGPPERELDVHGYRGAKPVRVGNAAAQQLQLDVYGEVLGCASICASMGADHLERHWSHFRDILNTLLSLWERKDRGIWEVRGPPRHFVHSKATAWLAFDRGIRAAREHGLQGELDAWTAASRQIRARILAEGVTRGGRFGRAFDDEALDASLLLLGVNGFIDARDARFVRTLDAVIAGLSPATGARGLLHRYPHDSGDGLPGGEGAFLLCSFWLAEALHAAGRIDEARDVFAALLVLRGACGLFAEQIDPSTGAHLGNFPQAFSHLGLINAALRLFGGERNRSLIR